MSTRDVGDRVAIRHEVRDPDGALTAATVVVAVTKPDGTTLTPAPTVSNPSLGIYDASLTLDAVGRWRWKWTVSGAVVEVAYGDVDARDPAPPIYATLVELKAALRITDSNDDNELLAKLTSASRRVDKDTGRPHGYGQDFTTSTRIYRPRHEELLTIDDIATSTGLIVEEGRGTSWSVVDSNSYDLLPENAEADLRAIETLQRVVGCWPIWGATRVRVTAKWGWPAVPDNIKNATVLLATRLFRRKDSPEGVAGFGDLGVVRVSRYDSDYTDLIGPYVRPEV